MQNHRAVNFLLDQHFAQLSVSIQYIIGNVSKHYLKFYVAPNRLLFGFYPDNMVFLLWFSSPYYSSCLQWSVQLWYFYPAYDIVHHELSLSSISWHQATKWSVFFLGTFFSEELCFCWLMSTRGNVGRSMQVRYCYAWATLIFMLSTSF